ncbi:hypothetical protein CU041_02100 [Thalassospira povalilytica]|uniref:Secreted protein n=1 Tax=Thalassospira povalilytica TaxID=732237 RepID=A0ABX4RCU7_9PROT|nr:hypothetical protein CU041_02100 [Thalassospira povalilytica]
MSDNRKCDGQSQQAIKYALPCLALPCLALPCRAVPCRAVPCRAVSCREGDAMGCESRTRPVVSAVGGGSIGGRFFWMLRGSQSDAGAPKWSSDRAWTSCLD